MARYKVIILSWLVLLITAGICIIISYLGLCVQRRRIVQKHDADLVDAIVPPVSEQHSRTLHDPWGIFFAEIQRDLGGDASQEIAIKQFLVTARPKHELCFRFPLPSMPIVIETNTGVCLLGAHLTNGTICKNALRGQSSWSPDPHVRDIISTALLHCGIVSNPRDCFAIDVGSNVGAHTLVMLQLGARVVAIEPQIDFCVATRLSAAAQGFANRSHTVCGGLAPSAQTLRAARLPVGKDNWRYFGKLIDLPYHLSEVPLVSLERLVASQRQIDFLKIDTDSIDCSVLQQAIDMMDARGVIIKAMLLESWDGSCKGGNLIGNQIFKLVKMGYTVYRTLVYERSWDDHHHDYENNFRIVQLPKGWTEEFHIGFNFVLWKANSNDLTHSELVAHPTLYPNWQYLFMKDVHMFQAGYKTRDL